jgi:hypothetical protein
MNNCTHFLRTYRNVQGLGGKGGIDWKTKQINKSGSLNRQIGQCSWTEEFDKLSPLCLRPRKRDKKGKIST